MRYIDIYPDASVPGDVESITLRMTEMDFRDIERDAEDTDLTAEELLTEIIHSGSVDGRIR